MVLYILTSYRVLGIVYLHQLSGARPTHILEQSILRAQFVDLDEYVYHNHLRL